MKPILVFYIKLFDSTIYKIIREAFGINKFGLEYLFIYEYYIKVEV
jgi:hypothetical protein